MAFLFVSSVLESHLGLLFEYLANSNWSEFRINGNG